MSDELTVTIDTSSLSLRDMVAIGKAVGRSVIQEIGSGRVEDDVFIAMLTVLRQKVDPAATADTILDAPARDIVVTGGDVPPTRPAPTKRRRG